MPVPASLFSPPLKGPGEDFHTENVGTHGPFVRSNTLINQVYSILVVLNGADARAVRPYMPGPASLFSPPSEGSGEVFCAENVGTHGPFVRSNTEQVDT